jgi:PAS domain S-box-containing protein
MVSLDFQKLYGNCHDAAFAVDLAGTVVWWSAAAERLLGYRASEAVGKSCSALLAGRDAAGCSVCGNDCHVLQMARKNEPTRNYDLEVRTARGRWLWVNVSTIIAPADGSAAVLHLMRDIHQRKETELLAGRIVADLGKLARIRAGRAGRQPAPAPGPDCTPRERKILTLLSQSRSTEQVAAELKISPATVRNHIRNILRKTRAHSRLEAVLHAIRNGII